MLSENIRIIINSKLIISFDASFANFVGCVPDGVAGESDLLFIGLH